MTDRRKNITEAQTRSDVSAFVNKLRQAPVAKTGSRPGRLLFAMDATASREPTWDRAMHLQAGMFGAASSLGGLALQLCYYRGFGEFHSTAWIRDADVVVRKMTGVSCLAGQTQIGKVLEHALNEQNAQPVQALVFVGDVVEEPVDRLGNLAGQLGLKGLPVFVFQEGHDLGSQRAMQQIAQLSGGAYAPFNSASASQLKALLEAVAVYAAGGRKALANHSRSASAEVKRLTQQLR